MKKLLLALLAVFAGTLLHAQSSAQCTRALDEAEQAFEQGRLLYILDRSANRRFYECLDNGGFSKEEEIRAKKLLVKAYLFSDNEAEAENSLIELLTADKEHQLTPEDPAELYFLYSKFKTEPVIRLAARLGGNKTFINQLQEFNTFQTGEKRYNERGRNTGLGLDIWGEVLAERHLGYGVEAAGGIQLRFASYEIEGDIIDQELSYTARNRSTALRLPILFRYNLWYNALNADGGRKKFIPYVYVGGSFDYIVDARYLDTSRTGGTAFTIADGEPNSSLTEFNQVSRQNASLFAGIGFKLRIGRAKVNFFNFDIRYDNSLFNYINPDNRWDNQDVKFSIGHVEDDLTINTVSISAGYIHSFYIPRKRKQYR